MCGVDYIDHAMQKCVIGYMRTAKSPDHCASVQSDQGLSCPLTESLDTTECMNGEQRTG